MEKIELRLQFSTLIFDLNGLFSFLNLENLEISKEGHLGTWVRPKMSELPELDPKMQFE